MVVAIGGGMLSSGVSLTMCIISDVGDQGTIKGLNIRECRRLFTDPSHLCLCQDLDL